MSSDPLLRPVWNCLNGRQAHLAVATGAAARIDPGYGPFAAARDTSENAQAALAAVLAGPDDAVWLIEPDEWPAPTGTRIKQVARLLQMVAKTPMSPQPGDGDFIALGDPDAPEMAALAYATAPGPWGPLTQRYGQFYGLRDGDRLMAMAGERMLPAAGLAELSGVCTWPEYRGAGLAARLVRHVMAAQIARGDVPYLHCYADNFGAIRIYERLGFVARREMVATLLVQG